jgi:hypothetical protein
VINAIDDTYGKYPASIGNVIVMERQYAAQLIQAALGQTLNNQVLIGLLSQTSFMALTNFYSSDFNVRNSV